VQVDLLHGPSVFIAGQGAIRKIDLILILIDAPEPAAIFFHLQNHKPSVVSIRHTAILGSRAPH
jgi:hypothetical protein